MPGVKQPLTVELALLGFIRRVPMHPYEIYLRLEQTEELGAVWHVKQAHLYAVLRRLEDEGYLTSITEPQGTRPPRKILYLTPDGEQAFTQWLHAPVHHGRDFRIEFLAKLFFVRQEGIEAVAALVQLQRHACQQRLDALESQLAVLPTAQAFERIVVQFRAGQLSAVMAWLDTCAEALLPTSA